MTWRQIWLSVAWAALFYLSFVLGFMVGRRHRRNREQLTPPPSFRRRGGL